jgi:hypothetical protein
MSTSRIRNFLALFQNLEFKHSPESLGSSYNFGFQSFLSFHFEDGQNFELLKSLHYAEN